MFFLKSYVTSKLTKNIFKYWKMIIFMEMDTIFPKRQFLLVTIFPFGNKSCKLFSSNW